MGSGLCDDVEKKKEEAASKLKPFNVLYLFSGKTRRGSLGSEISKIADENKVKVSIIEKDVLFREERPRFDKVRRAEEPQGQSNEGPFPGDRGFAALQHFL